ncbi:hypothetical protein ABT063_20310 [Streptomyces sp. NPDC002838]|uniref:hypothetical protein n=1 Tax=Streptomyces sp. NPDC002838 TaxID=3154436 RepID=UPI00331D02AD
MSGSPWPTAVCRSPRGAALIRAAGNARGSFTVAPGYGRGDPAFSAAADREVWPPLTP